jgi:ABC-type polysaccharide/polyol phosphate transport system ATPase subunit
MAAKSLFPVELGPCRNLGPAFTESCGRENSLSNGIALRLSKWGVRQRPGDLIRFAEPETFGRAKVCSAGVYVHLGFSVAIHADLGPLLLGEIFAVAGEDSSQGASRRLPNFGAAAIYHPQFAMPSAVECGWGGEHWSLHWDV